MTASGVDTEPVLRRKEPGISTCSLPLCSACLRGKGRATPVGSTKNLVNPDHFDVIKDGDLLPGGNS